jgi:ubiquinone/menaquinone biosynthesis C-methylase UbiE
METNIADKIRSSNIEVHNREAAIYDAIHPELFGSFEQRKITRDLDLIASIMPTGSPVRVLDIGCGTGNLTLKYLKRGYRVKAVDISPEMISILESKINPIDMSSVQLVVGDAEDLLGDTQTYGTWQIISFSSVLHHLPDYDVVLANAVRQLGPGGVLYICHEPLRKPRTKSGLVSRLASKILNGIETLYIYARKLLVYSTQSLRARKFFKRIDYRWSDYHSRLGIDAQEILRRLEYAGARTLLYETYRSRYSSLLAALDARLGISEQSHFRLIVRR